MPGGKGPCSGLWLGILAQVQNQPEEWGLEHPWDRRMATRVLLLGSAAESKDVAKGRLCSARAELLPSLRWVLAPGGGGSAAGHLPGVTFAVSPSIFLDGSLPCNHRVAMAL